MNWIKISDCLPPNDLTVLVYYDDKYWEPGNGIDGYPFLLAKYLRSYGNSWYDSIDGHILKDPDYWIPLDLITTPLRKKHHGQS